MANFTPWEVERQWLIHPSIYEQVPEDDRPDVMCDAVREVVDLDAIAAPYRDDTSYVAHYPAMMTALLYYAWSQGIVSSRAIARACEHSVDVMALTAMHAPDFEEIRAFRERHADDLVAGLVRLVKVARRVGLPWGPSEDDDDDDDESTALSFGRADEALEAAAAKWLATARHLDAEEDARLGAARDAPFPKWVPDRKKRLRKLREAREAIEREERARVEAQRLLAEDPDEDEDEDDGDESTRIAMAITDDDPRVQPPPVPEPENPLARRRRGRRPPSRISSRPHRHADEAPSEDPPPRVARSRSRAGADAHPHLHRPEPPRRSRVPSSEHPPQTSRARVRRRPTSDEPPAPRVARRHTSSDVMLQNLSADTRLILMETIIGTAMADGHIAAIEQRRIDKLVRTMRLDPRERQQVYATLRDGVIPPLPTVAELPDYEVRLHVFEQAAIMALADGSVDRAEHRYLKELADALELSISDAKQALRRANQATGG